MHKFTSVKKLTSIVLAVLIAFSCVVVGVSAASNVKVAFTNNKGWDKVYVYTWDSNDNALQGEWPGTQLTNSAQNDYGESVFYAEIPSNADGVVFTAGNSGPQTVDIDFNGQTTGWYCTDQTNGKWNVGTWDYKPDGGDDTQTTTKVTGSETTATTKEITGGKTVYFTNNKGWNVYAYAWDDKDNDVTKSWPGEAMTKAFTNDFGEDVYKITLPANAAGVVFSNNGGEQTVDLTPADNTGYYPESQSNGKWECGTWSPVEDPSNEVVSTGTTGTTGTTGPTTVPPTGKTVYFTNNKGWNVYAYAWDDKDNDVTKSWPGEAMTKAFTNDFGEDVYKITLPTNAAGVVFSNNGGEQTVDLTPADNTGYYPESQSNGKWECGTWSPVVENPDQETTTKKDDGETTTTKKVDTDSYTVYFTNNKGWNVYAYAWDSKDNDVTKSWPGEAMTKAFTNDFGEDVYKITLPTNAAGVVFSNNGGEQTVDLTPADNTGYYPESQNNGKWECGTWSPVVENPDQETTTKKDDGETTTTKKVDTDSYTVYFTNNKGWNVYAYAWDDKDNDVTKAWPGEAMTKAYTNDYGEDVYKITLPKTAAGVVFSNNGGDQTVDLTPADNTGYYPTSQNNGKWECGTWSPVVENPDQETTTKKDDGETTTTKKVDTDSYTVYFTNNKGWNVYAYAWDDKDNDVTKAWPGEAMTKAFTNDYGEDVYKITLPKAATGVVFSNNGGDQTVDLTPADNTGYYPTSQNNGKWECGTWSPVVEEPSETTKPVGETTTAPVETTTAPVETTTAPVETTTAPVETTTAPIIPQFQSGLKCSSYSLSLGNNIAINFKVKPANLTGYTNPYLIVTMNGEETRIDNYTTQSDGTIIFEFDKVYPQNVIDTASAVLYATKDNQVYYGEPYEKSVIGYADKYQDETLGSQNLAGLLVNLLRYATECQKLIGYKTDTLAESHIVRSAKRYSSTTLGEMVNVKNYSAVKCPGTAKCEWKSATLSLGSSVEIKVNFTAAEMENKSVKVEFNGASYVFGPEYLVRNEKYPDRVTFIYDGLYANQMHDTVSFTVMEGDTPVSDTMTYSIASYASQYYNDPSVGNLVTQMMLYGQQAEKYALNG